ncbi:hypothetical protein AB0O76_05860 [Streptomyces sp. NPDC086554]|uniref:golvesin C-terminal-like domain-containing protein n=1 Tax=Streptomyces sp. NPDC086554 TaxID=3154864 RepID=UPI003425598E
MKRTAGSPDPSAVPSGQRAELLGRDWKKSGDLAWTTISDGQGFHLLTAREKDGYAWRTAASLSEPGFDADAWIGNACVTGSGKHAVVVYAPRTFTNKAKLMARGGFTAVVDLETGRVNKLDLTASLSYYNPGCGTGESAVLTQSPGEDKAATRLVTVNAATGKVHRTVVTQGQVTSAIPTQDGIAAAAGARVVSIDAKGRKKTLTKTKAVPYRLTPDAGDGIVFLDRQIRRKSTATAAHIKHYSGGRRTTVLGSGPVTETGVTRAGANVYLTGAVKQSASLPDHVHRLPGSDKDATVSTCAGLVVQSTQWADGKGSPAALHPKKASDARPVNIAATLPATDKEADFTVRPLAAKASQWAQSRTTPSPALSGGKSSKGRGGKAKGPQQSGAGGRTEIVESNRACSVPRNDPRNQAMQPKPRQVEWAVDQAVNGTLNKHVARPANWKSLGMPAYQPQSLFPNPALEGGGRVPAQILLGVATQESNMWQAARSSVPGVTGNPLIGNYYGIDLYDGDSANDWDVNFIEADCGYGITQVTDHMRLAGREDGHGGAAWDYQKQRAVALDYTANIAAGLQILVDKWNTTQKAGIAVHDGNPKQLENWFFALWAYNSGFHANTDGNAPWGLGWTNNPANPEWDAGRTPFMEDRLGNEEASAAAHPQDWPYPEKVLGFAAHPPSFLESPGKLVPAFRAAWWNGSEGDATVKGSAKYHRAKVKPPEDLFCGPYNNCDPSKIGDGAENETGSGPCLLTTGGDKFKCWWHQSAQWKEDCKTYCGNEFMRFNDTYPEEADGTAYPPNCTTAGLPSNAMIIDDVPAGTPSVRPSCVNGGWTNQGSFSMDFGEAEAGVEPGGAIGEVWPSKVDLHQLGAGFGGHFYFGHTRQNDAKGQRLQATAQWKLGKAVNGPAKVLVHLPDHGAQTRYAKYEIETAHGTRTRVLDQRGDKNRWVSIGGYMFDGAPAIRLSTTTRDGTGDEDVAFDAVAVAPIDGQYVEDTVDAVAYFDEDQNIDVRKESQVFDTPLKSRQVLHDWAMKHSGDVLAEVTCIDQPGPGCVKPETKATMGRWNTWVKESGTSTTDHPDGKSIPAWMHYSNSYQDRPSSDDRPTKFDTDDSSYKQRIKAKVSYIKADGKVVEGSEGVQYDDRTADTHLPNFVMDTFKSIEADYGISPPNLNYSAKDLNEHNGKTTTTDTNTTGILPGRAYAALGVKPVVVDVDDNPVSDGSGTCVAVMTAAGGSIGYRPALADKGVTDEVKRWTDQVSNMPAPGSVKQVAYEIRNMFFNPGVATGTGSIFKASPPIWQELNFKACTDGTIQKIGDGKGGKMALLRSSYMPNQYLYHNNKAMGLDGKLSGSKDPVSYGNFENFSGISLLPPGSDHPYNGCTSDGGSAGNPWNISVASDTGTNPSDGHFCAAPGKSPDPEYSH